MDSLYYVLSYSVFSAADVERCRHDTQQVGTSPTHGVNRTPVNSIAWLFVLAFRKILTKAIWMRADIVVYWDVNKFWKRAFNCSLQIKDDDIASGLAMIKGCRCFRKSIIKLVLENFATEIWFWFSRLASVVWWWFLSSMNWMRQRQLSLNTHVSRLIYITRKQWDIFGKSQSFLVVSDFFSSSQRLIKFIATIFIRLFTP